MAQKFVKCKICNKELYGRGAAAIRREVADHFTFYHPEEWKRLTEAITYYKDREDEERKRVRAVAATITTDHELLINYYLNLRP